MNKKEAYRYVKEHKDDFLNKEEIKRFLRNNIVSDVAYIYYLQDPTMISQNCYVGQTTVSIQERLRSHIKEAKRNKKNKLTGYYNVNWINFLIDRGTKPEMVILEKLNNVKQDEIDIAEKWYIKSFKDMCILLTNTTDGGVSFTPTPEMSERISATLKRKYASGEIVNPNIGRVLTPEQMEFMRTLNIGRKHTPEVRAAQSARSKGRPGYPHTQKTKDRLSKKKQGSKNVKAILTETDVEQIKQLLFANELMVKEIATIFNINRSIISKMIGGERWKHCFTTNECAELQVIQKENKSKRTTGENNPMSGKYGALNPNYGKVMSDEQRAGLLGENNPMSKLTPERIVEMKLVIATRKDNHLTYKEIATIFSVSQTTIQEIASGKRWVHITIPLSTESYGGYPWPTNL